MEIAVFTLYPIAEEMGKIVAYQYAPCKNAGKDVYCDEGIEHISEVPVQKCSSEKQKEIDEQLIKKFGTDYGPFYSENAVCLDLEDVYIAGEPWAYTEASLIIAFTKHPDIVTDPNDPDYDAEKDDYFIDADAYLYVDFTQTDMKKGTLERVTKTIRLQEENPTGISLSQNKLIDRNDSFGLFNAEPEPKTFFSIEQRILNYRDNWAVDDN